MHKVCFFVLHRRVRYWNCGMVGNCVSFRETSVLPACKRTSTLPSGHRRWPLSHCRHILYGASITAYFTWNLQAPRCHPDLLATPSFSTAHFTTTKPQASLVSNNCGPLVNLTKKYPGHISHQNLKKKGNYMHKVKWLKPFPLQHCFPEN